MDERKPIPFNRQPESEPVKPAPEQHEPEKPEAPEQTKLHFCRVRGKEDASFYDPQTDIRLVFPHIMSDVLDIMALRYTDEIGNARLDNLRQCIYVLRIRLLEDTTPFVEQIALFDAAIRKNGDALVTEFYSLCSQMMLGLFGLFMRRDSRVDSDMLHSMLYAAEASTLCSQLPADLREAVRKSLRESPASEIRNAMHIAEENKCLTQNAIAVCPETGESLQNLRGRVRTYLSISGPATWDAIAAACDREFSNRSRKLSTDAGVALAVAYPTYEGLNLAVETEEGDGK